MPQKKQTIRNMTLKDLKKAVRWAEHEGWNPGINDAECFFKADKRGFYVGEIDGEMISTISIVKYKNDFAFLGFYIVNPEYRSMGYGLDIWNHVIEKHKFYTIGLDGVVAQQENYRKSGFVLAHRNIRYQGQKTTDFFSSNEPEIQQVPFPAIVEYDRLFFPSERKTFLEPWLNEKNRHSCAFIKNHEIKGYGVIRKCVSGYKIGPLFADDEKIAEPLFRALIDKVNIGDIFFIDVPETNLKGVNLVHKYNMNHVFETARMYTKEAPNLPIEKIFGISSFELG